MIKTMVGVATEIYFRDQDITKLIIKIDDKDYKCINYSSLSGEVQQGDLLLLNTTAVELKLGTGGYHFVVANLSRPKVDNLAQGHIMKLKYTPMQMNFLTTETQESKYHEVFDKFHSLEGIPVIVGSLHSVLAPCAIYLKSKKPDIKICYIMTEGGALPLYLSDIVRKLKEEGLIDSTITYGNAFGGDFECVNVYTALITAKEIVKADVTIVCMGPGIVGTETKLGFSGVEQGYICDAANKLGGYTVLIPRISFEDRRQRHYGISHHSITVLSQLCCTRANVAIPIFKELSYSDYIIKQIMDNKIKSLHNIDYVDITDIDQVLNAKADYLMKMGKGYHEDPHYFLTCAASAKLCLSSRLV